MARLTALGDGGGLGGVPGKLAAGHLEIAGRGESGGDDVDAGAAGGGVEDEAGGGVGVVGDLGALVGGEGTVGSASRVETTVKPAVVRRARRRAAKARVMSFSRRLLGRWAPVSGPPWAGSRRMMVRGMGCWAVMAIGRNVVRMARVRCVAICRWGGSRESG